MSNPPSGSSNSDDRKQRLAAALRANLLRRKPKTKVPTIEGSKDQIEQSKEAETPPKSQR
jgi:hypothetical protein